MSFNATCPECDKSIRLRDDVAGKKIKCPECAHKFVAKPPGAEDEGGYAVDEAPPKKKRKRDREDDGDDDRDDDDDRPRKKKSRDVPQAPTPIAPLVWGIIAILCPIGMLVGFIAIYRGYTALADLPDGRRGDSARRNMWIAIVLGVIGCVESLILGAIGTYLRLSGK